MAAVVEGKDDEAPLDELVGEELQALEKQAKARGVPDKLMELMLGQRDEMGIDGVIATVEQKLWPPHREGNLLIYIDYYYRNAIRALWLGSLLPGGTDYLKGWKAEDQDIAMIHAGVLRLL